MVIDLAAIIMAIGSIITAWFAYNQKTKDKTTSFKIEQLRKQIADKNKRRADNSAIVHGELWETLHELHADRVYIVQPHPLGNESMVSVYYESKRKGIEAMKPRIQHLKMSEVAVFCRDLSKNLFMYITDIDKQVQDRYAKSIFSACGTTGVIVKRLSDNNHDWVGSIFVEYTDEVKVSEDDARRILHETAMSIQYILPEFID